jgi:ATP adenylyltransferase
MIKAHKTAIKRGKMSTPVKNMLNNSCLDGRILDYGCGRGKDVEELKALGFDITGYDPHWSPENPSGKFDTIMCNYVLNVIPSWYDRVKVMDKVLSLLNDGGTAIFTARNVKDIESSKTDKWKPFEDGYITTADTFQAGISSRDIIEIYKASYFAGKLQVGFSNDTNYSMVVIKKV